MEQVAKQFTIIDFLGMLIPGALVVLAVNTCLLDLTFPAKDFFGDNVWVLSAYFIMLSYFFGHGLNQLGMLLEDKIWKVPNMHAKYCVREEIQDTYKKIFHVATFPENEAEQLKAGQDIFHYVQKEKRPQRILIFSAFYAMSRTLVVSLIIILIISLPCVWAQLYEAGWKMLIVYVIFIAVFRLRWVYYEEKCVNEAYMIFLTEKIGQSAHNAHNNLDEEM